MKWTGIVATAVALTAARRWLRAGKVPIKATWTTERGRAGRCLPWADGWDAPGAHRLRQLQREGGARWTAVSVVLTLASAVAGILTQF